MQGWLTEDERPDPITWTGNNLTFELTDVALEGSLNLPVSLWMRYVSTPPVTRRRLPMGEVPMKGDATIDGVRVRCEEGCELQQLYLSGSSSSVSDVHGSLHHRRASPPTATTPATGG